jgi:hypothetical protein
MKKIILKILFLLFIVIGLDQLIGFAFSKYIFQNTFSGEKGGGINYLIEKAAQLDFVIMGSSRAKYQIDPNLITSMNGDGYNAGMNGVGTILFNSVLLDLLSQDNKIPKSIILQIDVQDFEKKNETIEISALYPFYSKSTLLQHFTKSLSYEEKIKTKFTSYRFNGKVLNILFNFLKRNKLLSNNGFGISEAKLDSTNFVVEHKVEKPLVFSELKLEALNSFINNCKKHKVNLFVVLTPSYGNKLYRPFENERILKTIKSTSNSVCTIDLSNVDNMQEIKSANYWKDGTHMNKWGAELFSKKLNEYILNCLISNPSSNHLK